MHSLRQVSVCVCVCVCVCVFVCVCVSHRCHQALDDFLDGAVGRANDDADRRLADARQVAVVL